MNQLFYSNFKFGFVAVLTILTLNGCNSSNPDAIFSKLSSSRSGIDFTNQLNYTDTLTVLDFEYMFNGAGVGLIDINNDGLQDIYFSGNMVSGKLYLNKGNLRFEDITEKAGVATEGWTYGVSIIDINQDGFQDIYLCKAGNRRTLKSEMKNQFFINNGNNTFTDRAEEMGLNSDGYDIHAAFFDYDKDGDLDMYLLRNAFVSYNRNTARTKMKDGGAPSTDCLYKNDGKGHFTDVSKEAGITIEGFGLGVSLCDLNNDGWTDVYVSNDFLTNDLVWINNQDGTFSNKAGQMLKHQTYNGMGNDVMDYNNDGLEDIVVVDMLPPDNKRWKLTARGNTYEEFQYGLSFGYEPQYVRNTLQLNNGNGTFSEIGQLAGIDATEWSWAPLFADYNNDGYKDLFISNGYRQDITNLDFIKYGKQANFVGTAEANRKERLSELKKFPGIQAHNYLYENMRNLTFRDASKDWGMEELSYSNGAAYGDLDNDGDLDLVINNLDQVSVVYENKTSGKSKEQSWLRLGFKGPDGNKGGIGTKVWIWQNSQMQYQYFAPIRGYLSTVESFVHFGIANKVVDSVRIEWPDGSREIMKNISPGKLLIANYLNASQKNTSSNISSLAESQLFEPYNGINYVHQEDPYVDFKLQPLLPKHYSHEGPGQAVGDVNGDGLEDLFVGSSADNKSAIYLQNSNGFVRKELPFINKSDNMGALFFDADTDGDLDLLITQGGTLEKRKNDPAYTPHFFTNDGRGNFSEIPSLLNNYITSASSIAGSDFDRDGDIDLFIAGRINPGEYPTSPRSFLLRNESQNGQIIFNDVSSSVGADLSHPGMVTTVIWTDFNNDGWADIIMAGEYMPVLFFQNQKGQFLDITANTGLQHTNGWWNGISGADFDQDGDMDYVLGNLGLNSPYRASAKEPVCVYYNDYDKDGKIDPVICHYVDGVEQVFHARDDINRQMQPFRARFRTYQEYADVNFRKAFRKEEIEEAKVLKAERFANAYIENLGGGKFSIKDLPLTAQFAPLSAMIAEDLDGDGNTDIWAIGNSYSTEVQTGRYDAQGTLFLKGDGKGNLVPQRKEINVQTDNRSLVRMTLANGSALYSIGANSDSLRAFRLKTNLKFIDVNRKETYAIINLKNGKKYRQEFYYGSSYISASSRKLAISDAVGKVNIFQYDGKNREILMK